MVKQKTMKMFDLLTMWLLIISGIVHGLLVFSVDVLEMLGGGFLVMLIYSVVGISAVYKIIKLF